MTTDNLKVLLSVPAAALGVVSCHGKPNKAATADTAAEKRPNVVVIYVDDMDNSMCGAYGGYCQTPNIDRLASQGMRFTRFYPSSAVSQPSRYSLLTGKYASRNLSEAFERDSKKDNQAFVRWNTDIVDQDVTIAKVMKAAGYYTGFVGKWHLGFPNYDPLAIPGDADPDDPAIKKFFRDNYDRTLAHVQKVSGFDTVANLYSINIRWIPVPDVLDRHNQEWVTKGAIDFLDAASKRQKPFLLYMATTLPHVPDAILSLKDRPATPLGYGDEIDVQPSRASVLELLGKQTGLNKRQQEHFASMKWLDDGVGAVLARLDSLGLSDNTIVILASDNDVRAKMSCYDGKLPLMIRWPGRVAPGTVNDELVSNIDFAPTIYDLCGAKAPEGTILDGVSLRPLLEGRNDGWRQSLYLEVLYTRGIVTKDYNYVAVRYPRAVMEKITPENRKDYNQEGTKISQNDGVTKEELTGEHVRYGTDVSYPAYYDFDQLYDLRSDPREQKNLATNKRYETVLLEMKRLLAEYSAALPRNFGEFKQILPDSLNNK